VEVEVVEILVEVEELEDLEQQHVFQFPLVHLIQ
jgi:hypothetical protein